MEPAAPNAPTEGRILVLEPDDALNTAILSALHDAAPAATVDVAHTVEDAQSMVLEARPDLFVLDMDGAQQLTQDFLLDLRTSHPHARAIVLTGRHLPAEREHAAAIGAIHFLEKPFRHRDFVNLVAALLRPVENGNGEKFQGTLSDLHLSDIIQLKCMSGTTTALEFTGPRNEKARVYFENGQVRHAVAPGREGVDAFNEIVSWKGGKISEVPHPSPAPRTIDLDWQFLLMEAVRQVDEASARRERRKQAGPALRHKILVIDDSLMLLSFVQEILGEANYAVITAATAQEGLRAALEQKPDLVLLDYLLPDFRGDEVARRLAAEENTARLPILYMSGFGADLENAKSPNVVGIVNKPFTSDHLLTRIEQQLRGESEDAAGTERPQNVEQATAIDFAYVAGPETEPGCESEPATPEAASAQPSNGCADTNRFPDGGVTVSARNSGDQRRQAQIFFAGETSFFSLHNALRTIEKEKLAGVLRCSWSRPDVELFARAGRVALVTTRDAELYCPEAPTTLAEINPERLAHARGEQARTGRPLILTLVDEELVEREPAFQLVQHYGQKLFAQLWAAPRVRFAFEPLDELPPFARETVHDDDMDHWALGALRFIQFSDVAENIDYDESWVPAYTRDGFERVQKLKLTVAEAQFGSQFNGTRSLAQVARNLRLDLKSARLTLFRFVTLEIVECWPPTEPGQVKRSGLLRRKGRTATRK